MTPHPTTPQGTPETLAEFVYLNGYAGLDDFITAWEADRRRLEAETKRADQAEDDLVGLAIMLQGVEEPLRFQPVGTPGGTSYAVIRNAQDLCDRYRQKAIKVIEAKRAALATDKETK